MDNENNQSNPQIKDLSEIGLKSVYFEMQERVGAEALRQVLSFFENMSTGENTQQEGKEAIPDKAQIQETIEAASKALQVLLDVFKTTEEPTDILSVIKGNEKLLNMTLDEAIKSGELVRAIENAFPTKKAESQAIQALKSILPSKYYITNNKLSNEITKDFIDNGEISIAVINPRRKGEILTYNSLTYEGKNISITGRQQFTAYDRSVHNAVCTLYVSGNDTMTPQMIYRTLNGMKDSDYISPQAAGAVTKSIDKSRFTRLKVDFTAEAKARNMNLDKAIIDSNLLQAEIVTVMVGGNKRTAFRILKTPVLYDYAQHTKQIVSVPIHLLNTRDAIRNSDDIIPIKEYLIRRIETMRHNGVTNKIAYDTIFLESGISITSPTQRKRMRKYITSILNLWKNRDEYIDDFKEYKIGKSYKGIEIFY